MHGKFQCPLGLELLLRNLLHITEGLKFQCPLGLIPHFYSRIPSLRSKIPRCFNALSGLYLISTLVECMDRTCVKEVSMPFRAYTSFLLTLGSDEVVVFTLCFNALSGLYLISTVPLQKPRFYAVSRACFCRYLSEYSDNSRFSCMLTFWTYLMRCTYPRHCIKYSTKYYRCHPIFSLS